MHLVFGSTARRLAGLALLLCVGVPMGVSVTGCSKGTTTTVYCNGLSSGPVVGQVASITLSPSFATTGESLNYGQIGSSLSATATDCKNNQVNVSKFTYASSNPAIADINPNTGQVCAGTWNRNTGGGVPDYTICTPFATAPPGSLSYVTATGDGASSNAIPVYIHPTVTSVQLGSASTDCTNDPATNCTCPGLPPPTTSGTAYDQMSCVSQNQTRQLIARVYAGSTNITCQVGHLTFSPLTSSNVATIDQNGVATASQPGSTVISASIANSSTASQAGFFSTCPPASVELTAPGYAAGTNSINVSLNNAQALNTLVYDTNGVQLTGVSLEFVSTTPQTIPASSGSVTPLFPGAATITAVCQPPACNSAPFSQIGYLGNGKPLTSNGITVNTTGTSATVLFAGSTQSQYLYPYDTTTGAASALIKLQFVPNSMVINQSGTEIFLGSPQALMEVSTSALSQTAAYTTVQGTVLSVSPDGSTVVVTDPTRQTVSLVSAANGAVTTSYNGIGTASQWTPDSQTVYITLQTDPTTGANTLLTHSNFTDWQATTTTEQYNAVAVMVPAVGAYFGGPAETDGRSYCPSQTAITPGTPPSITNNFAPLADVESASINDQLAATTDGKHILGATAAAPARLNDIAYNVPQQIDKNGVTVPAACPTTVNPGYFTSNSTPHPFAGPVITAIDSVVPATNSALAFVTYTGTSGLLPEYVPTTGALSYLTLGNGATAASAPVAGVFSTDNLTFFAGTSGDNQIHLFSINGTTATETSALKPQLPCSAGTNLSPTPACTNGAIVMPNLLVQHPRKTLN